MTDASPNLDARVAALEAAVAELQSDPPRTQATPPDIAADEPFWALTALEERSPDSVHFTGSVDVADSGRLRWQQGLSTEAVMDLDWASLAPTIDALAHPARLTILQLIMSGIHTTGDLLQQEGLGTTGQLHHHLRQLVAAGWLTSSRRGHYAVPAPRVIPMMIMLVAATH